METTYGTSTTYDFPERRRKVTTVEEYDNTGTLVKKTVTEDWYRHDYDWTGPYLPPRDQQWSWTVNDPKPYA